MELASGYNAQLLLAYIRPTDRHIHIQALGMELCHSKRAMNFRIMVCGIC